MNTREKQYRQDGEILKNIVHLVKNGSRTTRVISQSIIAKTFRYSESQHIINTYFGSDRVILPRYNIGKDKSLKLKRVYNQLLDGTDLSTNIYKCRIPIDVLRNAIDYIFDHSQPIPGFVRNVASFNHSFNKVPSLYSFNANMKKMWTEYNNEMISLNQSFY